jgi:acyl carrier protein
MAGSAEGDAAARTEPLTLEGLLRYLTATLGRAYDVDPLADLCDDYGFDSIDTLELLVALEDLGIDVDADAFAGCRSIFDFHQAYAGQASALAAEGALQPASISRLEGPVASGGLPPTSSGGATGLLADDEAGDFVDPEALFTGRMVRMRPPFPGDSTLLARLAFGHGLAFGGRDQTIPPDQLLAELGRDALVHLVLEPVGGGPALGHVTAYQPDLRNGRVKLAVAVVPEQVGRGAGVEGIVLLARYVFTTWSFRKIYLELPDFVFDRVGHRLRRYAAVEGQLRDYVFLNGRYRDLYIVALAREALSPLAELVLGRSR